MDVRSERNRSSRGSGNWKWARMSERARHTGEGVARRKAHQERQRDEREQREEADRAAGTALPPEEGGVELVSADDAVARRWLCCVLDGVHNHAGIYILEHCFWRGDVRSEVCAHACGSHLVLPRE